MIRTQFITTRTSQMLNFPFRKAPALTRKLFRSHTFVKSASVAEVILSTPSTAPYRGPKLEFYITPAVTLRVEESKQCDPHLCMDGRTQPVP